MTITSIESGPIPPLTLTGSFGCSVPVTFTSQWDASPSPAVVELLANKSNGDPLKITATFKIPGHMAWNLQQITRMTSPDFLLHIEKLDDVPGEPPSGAN